MRYSAPDHPWRISLNPLGAVVAAYVKNRGELVFSAENATHALIEEPPRDQRNAYWRDEPHTLIEFVICALLARNPRLATPGGIWSILADPELLRQIAEIEASEGDEYLRALALHVLGMMKNEEHFPQHRAAAIKALRIYGATSALHKGNRNAWKHGDRSAEAEEQLKVITASSRILRLLGKVRNGVKLQPDEMDEIISYLR